MSRWVKLISGKGPGPMNVLIVNEEGLKVVTTRRVWKKIQGKQDRKEKIVASKTKASGNQGFFDLYKDLGGGGAFMKKDEKDFLIQNGITFHITGLQKEGPDEFNAGGRWVAFAQVPNSETGDVEERKISYPIDTNVPTRDSMLAAMKEYFTESPDAEPVAVKMVQPGRAILLVNANS